MFELLGWILVGAIAGWLASILMKTNNQQGCIINIVVGMIGSLVAGTIVTLLTTGTLDLFNTTYSGLNIVSILASVVGAVIFIGILKLFRK